MRTRCPMGVLFPGDAGEAGKSTGCVAAAPGGSAPLSNEKVRVKSIYWQCLFKSDAVCAMTG